LAFGDEIAVFDPVHGLTTSSPWIGVAGVLRTEGCTRGLTDEQLTGGFLVVWAKDGMGIALLRYATKSKEGCRRERGCDRLSTVVK
jgi:hypothetical protein